MYVPERVQYQTFVSDHKDELDLAEPISLERRNEQPYHEICLVRRLGNDMVFPYNTPMLLGWYEQKKIEPNTRENLEHLQTYINYKKMCWQQFSHILTSQVTPEFLLAVAQNWWSQVLKTSQDEPVALQQNGYGAIPVQEETPEYITNRAKAFLDLDTLVRAGFVHQGMTSAEAAALLQQKPIGTWIVRHSSQHGAMPHTDIFSCSYACHDTVRHTRFLIVRGVGIYQCNDDAVPSTFKALFEARGKKPPEYACLVDVLLATLRRWSPQMLVRTVRMNVAAVVAQ